MKNLSGADLNNRAAVCSQGESRESLSSFPAYPAYKDSGVEWQEVVPADWPRSALKYLADYQNGYPFKPEDWGEKGLPIIRISQLTGDTAPNYYSGELDDRVKVNEGDLLFSWSATIDSFIWAGGTAWLNQHIFKVSPTDEADQQFLFYLIKLVAPKLADFDAHGSTMRHIKKESLSERLHVPTLEEQTQIARFLDHETARIDALIEEQQRLIELLKEKRQAVISHAVTKGLDPTAPMKDSGVDWLGEVPAHWAVLPLKFLVEEKVAGPYGASLTKAMYTDSGYRVYGQQQVISDDFFIGDYYISEEKFSEMQRYAVFPGDVLVSVMGTIGKVSVVPVGVEAGIINPRLVRYRFASGKVVPRFVKILLMSLRYQSRLREESQGSTMEGLNMAILGDLPLVLPPLDAQHPIVAFVENYDSNFNELVSQAASAVDLLQERRSALISAAVTGKIDVRDWRPATAKSAQHCKTLEA